jgi:tRNA modification GTPase
MGQDQSLDTIAAPATPLGRSAIAVVRIDGPLTATILEALAPGVVLADRMATHTTLRLAGEVLDDCVAVFYRAPRSFTGNDLAEVSVHGSPLVVDRVLRASVALGARLAEAGEFTERAVLNGKLDLVQAEAVADLIASRTGLQARLSLSNLAGTLSAEASRLREDLLQVISRLEAALDFSEEGYEFVTQEQALGVISAATSRVDGMLATYGRGRATTSGLTAVILGRPNAGKSTLLNRLVGSDRAIVTAQPGTTRDLLRETIEIGGLPVCLVDTAGLRRTTDPVEEIGIDRARSAAESAEIAIYLIDAAAGQSEEDRVEISRLNGPLVVYTKMDLGSPPAGELAISAVRGDGMQHLLARLDELVRDRYVVPEGSPVIVNQRQEAALRGCREGLFDADGALRSGWSGEVVLVDLYRAANALGLLTGTISNDEILAEIFSKFCIGK